MDSREETCCRKEQMKNGKVKRKKGLQKYKRRRKGNSKQIKIKIRQKVERKGKQRRTEMYCLKSASRILNPDVQQMVVQ